MTHRIVKISIKLYGHPTSISLEQAYLDDLRMIAQERQQTLQELVESIDKTRKGNLCSALRLFVLTYWKTKGQDLIEDLVDSES
jgi:predicted DNA-binding ribbon-helix-helix protein